MNPLLNLRSLSFTWPGDRSPVLTIEAFQIFGRERLFLNGPSGSGKSTLLALIGGLIRPDRGTIEFDGVDLTTLSGPKRDRFRADHLGVIFQQFNLLPWLDVRANVLLPCRFSKLREQRAGDLHNEAERLLNAMDLDASMWSRRADALSVGQQQRVAAARALIGKPELILADEPTSALDADRRQAFLDLLFEQADAAGSALLFVSHDRELATRFDRAVDLEGINRAGVAA